jgi:hypothetical protein
LFAFVGSNKQWYSSVLHMPSIAKCKNSVKNWSIFWAIFQTQSNLIICVKKIFCHILKENIWVSVWIICFQICLYIGVDVYVKNIAILVKTYLLVFYHKIWKFHIYYCYDNVYDNCMEWRLLKEYICMNRKSARK